MWERTTKDDFTLELYILPFLALLIVVHVWGTRKNRSKARAWAAAHAPLLSREFVQVGHARPQLGDDGSVAAVEADKLLKEKKADEYTTYATGRQNVAFVDFKLSLAKRYNPLMRLGDHVLPLFFDTFPPPQERLEATAYVFDGQESKIAPAYGKTDASVKKVGSSTFDGFVFAIVHKDTMKRLRDDRYDLSLTTTRDHAKLPLWVTVMSESAEVTDALVTPDLIKAVEQAGDALEALIVSDQPMDQPKTYVVFSLPPSPNTSTKSQQLLTSPALKKPAPVNAYLSPCACPRPLRNTLPPCRSLHTSCTSQTTSPPTALSAPRPYAASGPPATNKLQRFARPMTRKRQRSAKSPSTSRRRRCEMPSWVV